MEVTSSTTSSTLQDNTSHMLPYTATASAASSGPVVSTSGAESDGLDIVVHKETSVAPLEVPVRYGPMLSPSMYSTEPVNYTKDVRDSKAVHGSCGLYNLGNTCFMNAGLQSLMSCAPLVKFFCENYTLTDANKHTLTGHFYILLCKMWCGNFSVVHPRKFKEFLGFYHSQFEDYRQHDCQEFLALLLDTLHEQLNNAPAASKHTFTTSLLPVTSSSATISVSVPEKQGPASIATTSKSKHLSQATRDCIEVIDDTDSSDLNNKDSGPSLVNLNFKTDERGSDCRKSNTFLSIVESVSGSEVQQSLTYPSERSPSSETSVLDTIIASPSSHGDITGQKSPAHVVEDDIISSSYPPLKRYTSRSNLDDVTSSDSGNVVKPSLKRVSSGNLVSTFGPIFHSEDSNHSSVSAHSTDSEQSSAFKRLKIDAAELNRNSNNIIKDSVTSSSDCKKNTRNRKNMLNDNNVLRESGNILVSGNINMPSSIIDLNVIDNMVSSCQDALCVNVQSPDKPELQSQLSPGLPSLDDFYSKETKTLNTNVVSEFLQEITSDSEKFAKLDNRYRPPSKEINILQEAFGEEDKAEKVLIGHRFGNVKDTNLYAHSTVAVVKQVKNSDPNVLNNSLEMDVMAVEAMSKFVPSGAEVVVEENNLPLKLFPDNHKLGEEEKNVQMQAYTKFNTIPDRSNIRTDLIDAVPDPDSMEVDEADIESSDDDDVEVASRTSTVEECSSVPNCLRHCSPSEVVMANRSWDEYLAKNDSIIVSTFQGQFRSTVVCSECSHVSVTYEPFMYLSLPIPHAMEQQICVVYISQSKPPIRYLLNLLKTDKIGMAKNKLCELIGHEDGDVIMAEVLDSHISRILDNNILLKYVNTFNRKIYAFEVISMDIENPLSVGCVSNDHLMNNKESPSHQHDFEIPPSSRADMPYAVDGQVSNQSFDSINVNSPSSRDTLDYMLSDSETCELTSQGQEPATSYFSVDDDDGAGECQSTSGITPAKKSWARQEYAGSHLSWNLDHDSGEAESSITGHNMASSSSPVGTDNQVNSCTSGFWHEENEENKDLDDGENQGSEDETVVNEACSSLVEICEGSSAVHHSHISSLVNNSPLRTEEDEGILTEPGINAFISSSTANVTSVTSTVSIRSSHHQTASSSSTNTQGGTSRNPSCSCPSPDGVSQNPDHDTTLLSVAARLEEGPGSYFLHRSQNVNNYDFYQQEGTSDVDTSGADALHEKKPKWDPESSRMSTFPTHKSPSSDTRTMPIDPQTDQWRSCAICLEDLLDTELLTHMVCNGVFCQNCLEMSVKHTADVSAFCCPICLHPANVCEDFVPLGSATKTKPKIRTLPMSIAYRQNVRDNTGSSMLQLFGHPNIIHMPSVITGDALYSLVDRLVSPLLTSYSIILTDGQGLTCSRCTYSWHCTGCEIAREGEITLQTSDCLTVHVRDTLSSDQVSDMQFVHEDVSMAGLRSSEPTTIMDCFGAFTQSEILDEHNPWYCPQCEKNQCAKKTMTVWRYPDNLIIHLKRFVYQDLSSTKVDTKVIFPQAGMDVRGFLSGPSSHGLVYDLYSIVCHFGGASAGHYTCYSKHPLTSQWYYYNDETVTAQSPSESEYSSGYVLYYQRHGTAVEFTPPQTLPCFDDGLIDTGVAPSSAFINGSTTNSHGGGNNSMALVLFQPPTISGPKRDNKTDKADDYDNEGRWSPCYYDSLTVHFGTEMSGPHDNLSDVVVETSTDDKTHMAEPDSTLDFYS